MKGVIHESRRDVFERWLDDAIESKVNQVAEPRAEYQVDGEPSSASSLHYYWPQICYDVNTYEPIHLVFERQPHHRFFDWPVDSLAGLPFTNLDFSTLPPSHPDGSAWDFANWYQHALNGPLQRPATSTPTSFWNWRCATWPQGNLTCDLDLLCRTQTGEFVGVEATEIYYVDENINKNQDVFEHFRRLFTMRRGSTGGFNIGQLTAQFKLMNRLDGLLFMIFHQIDKSARPNQLLPERVLLVEIDEEVLGLIQNLITNASLNSDLRSRIQFASMHDCLEHIGAI